MDYTEHHAGREDDAPCEALQDDVDPEDCVLVVDESGVSCVHQV